MRKCLRMCEGQTGLCYARWTTWLRRTNERGNERLLVPCFTVSPPSISIFFWVLGFVCVLCLLGLCLVLFLLSTMSRSFQLSTSLNDRLGCHGAHGMGEKKCSVLPDRMPSSTIMLDNNGKWSSPQHSSGSIFQWSLHEASSFPCRKCKQKQQIKSCSVHVASNLKPSAQETTVQLNLRPEWHLRSPWGSLLGLWFLLLFVWVRFCFWFCLFRSAFCESHLECNLNCLI